MIDRKFEETKTLTLILTELETQLSQQQKYPTYHRTFIIPHLMECSIF